MIATLTIHLHLPACASLKEKRGRIQPLIARLHRELRGTITVFFLISSTSALLH